MRSPRPKPAMGMVVSQDGRGWGRIGEAADAVAAGAVEVLMVGFYVAAHVELSDATVQEL